MSRIVLTTIGSLGDLHPKIAIALELPELVGNPLVDDKFSPYLVQAYRLNLLSVHIN